MAEFHTLRMSSVYMHQIHIVGESDSRHYDAVLTDLAVELEEVDRQFMVERFVDALDSKALKIVPTDNVDSPVPRLTENYFKDKDLLSFSKSLATRLAKVQKLTAKPGLMVVADANIGGKECLLVAKVEHQHAMRVNATETKDGLKGIAIEHIRHLVFSELNKVYKIAVLFQLLIMMLKVPWGRCKSLRLGLKPLILRSAEFMGIWLMYKTAVLSQITT